MKTDMSVYTLDTLFFGSSFVKFNENTSMYEVRFEAEVMQGQKLGHQVKLKVKGNLVDTLQATFSNESS